MANENPLFIYFETYGCSANQNNAEIMSGLVVSAGLSITNNPDIADILVLNTCVVKGPTEKRMESRIKKLLIFSKPLIISGCMPNVRNESKIFNDKNIYLLGTRDVKKIVNLIKGISDNKRINYVSESNEVKLVVPKKLVNKKVGITQILEGCAGACTFCLTTKAKGKLFSYPKEEIINNIKADLDAGCKEIWITSQDNGAYGLDIDDKGKYKLVSLLNDVLSLNGNFRVRLGMINPNHVLKMLDELIEVFKHKKMYKFLHIPIQSGSNKILKLMNRPYTKKNFFDIIKKFKSEIPDIMISTDIIVAFPGETDDDFSETLDVINYVKPQILNLSKFWPMKGTLAANIDQVSVEVTRSRSVKVMDLHLNIAHEFHKTLLNKEFNVLLGQKKINDMYLGRNDNYNLVIVNSEKSLLGKSVKVKIIKASPHYVYGKII